MEAPGERSDLCNLSIADETSQSRKIIGAEGRAVGYQVNPVAGREFLQSLEFM